jgi:tungstate transport system ATP-binding protein
MAIPPLAVADVRVVYDGRVAVEASHLEARAGEVLAVIGPNGSGKSTLLRALGLLESPAAATVLFHGRAVEPRERLAVRRRMAMVFQQPLLADMTVAANVGLGLRFRGGPAAVDLSRVERWMERLNIAALRDRRASTLSGGEAQRVALARALVLAPEVLLLDEPFGGLDQPTRAALVSDLAGILRSERVTTVMVTHDRAEAQALADRVAVLMGGRLRQLDETARVFRAPVSEEVARFVGIETIVTGEILASEPGLALVAVAGRTLEVTAPGRPGERVRLCIRPEDVSLAPPAEIATPSSARNHLPATVSEITASTAGVRVVVDCGFPLVTLVTPRAVTELGLARGVPVVATFNASAPHLIR